MKTLHLTTGILALLLVAGAVFLVMPSRKASPKAAQVTLESPRENPANNHSTSLVAQRPQFAAASASLETPKPIKPELPAQIQAYLAQPNQRPKMTGLPLVDATGCESPWFYIRCIDFITDGWRWLPIGSGVSPQIIS
jgi:hypothetical protein